jgi:PKD repeat protein/predicted secreted protein
VWLIFSAALVFPADSNVYRVKKITETQRNSTVSLEPDQLLEIHLEMSPGPGAGYSWHLEEISDCIIKEAKPTVFISHQPDMVGSTATQILYYSGQRSGKQALKFLFCQSWDKQRSILNSFEIAVDSKGVFSGHIQPEKAEKANPPLIVDNSAGSRLPAVFNWCDQGMCTPVKNQGSCGSCWAFASVGPMEINIKIKDGIEVDLSEQYLVSCNTDDWGCGGGLAAFKYFKNVIPPEETQAGAVYEAEFPYSATDEACNGPHNHPYKIVDYGTAGSTAEEIKQAIYDFGPIYVSVCSDKVFQAYTGGIFTGTGGTSLNHAVTLTGWDESGSTKYWHLRNSWGSSWGENGYMRIAYGANGVGSTPSYLNYLGNVGPNSYFTYNIDNLTAQFTDQSICGDCTLVAWSWSFGDGSTSTLQNPSHTYAQPGTYEAALTVTTNSSVSSTMKRKVYIPVTLTNCQELSNLSLNQAAWTYYRIIVPNNQTDLKVSTSGGSGDIDLYVKGDTLPGHDDFQWKSTGATNDEIVIVNQPQSSVYYLGLYAYTAIEGVSVKACYGLPAANFTVTTYKKYAYFSDKSEDSDDLISTWNWNFGDGQVSAEKSPNHIYGADGTYNVSLTVTNHLNQTDTMIRQIIIPNEICASASENSSNFHISKVKIGDFIKSSAASTYSDFSSSVIALTPNTPYNVTFTQTYSGSTYSVYFKAWADFNLSGYFSNTLENVFDCGTKTTSPASGTITIPYTAQQGFTRFRVSMKYDTAPEPCSNFSYGEVEDYTIQVLPFTAYCPCSANDCTEEYIKKVTVETFENTSDAQKYTNFTTKIIPMERGKEHTFLLTPGFPGDAFTEYWKIWIDYNQDLDFGDENELVFDAGSTSSTEVSGSIKIPLYVKLGQTRMRIAMKYVNPDSTNAGNHNPPEACDNTFPFGEVEDYMVEIMQRLAPKADFSVSVNQSAASFTDCSSDYDGTIVSRLWNFGDGQNSTEQHPVHQYALPGNYSVCLQVTDNDGLSSTKCKEVQISGEIGNKDDFAGVFKAENAGLWLRLSDNGSWSKLSNNLPDILVSGDLNGDKLDDLVCVFMTSEMGAWVRYTHNGVWEKLSINYLQLKDLVSADVNGDGIDDLIGSWTTGLWWKNSENGQWTQYSSQVANQICSNDFDNDNKADVIGSFPSGIWIRYADNGLWEKQSINQSALIELETGDLNGDNLVDIAGNWTYGCWYRDAQSGLWIKLHQDQALTMAIGDVNGLGKDDIVGVWPTIPGIWFRYSENQTWQKISNLKPAVIVTGKFH